MTIQKTIIAAALITLMFAGATAMQKSIKANNQKTSSQNSKALVVVNGNDVKYLIETPDKDMWCDIKKNHRSISTPVIIGQTQNSKIFVTQKGIASLKFKSRM